MPVSNQQTPNSDQRDHLTRVISQPRFASYLTAAGHDWDKAWRLYIWNAKLGEAFHLPIQTVEVALRNRICAVFTARFGRDWGSSQAFLDILDTKLNSDLMTVKHRLAKRSIALDNGQIVAGLSFGFWVGTLRRRYNQQIWSSDLRVAFPLLPADADHRSVSTRFSEIAHLRNRISHHEPIFKRNISEDYSKIIGAIDWMCPISTSLIKPHCAVPTVMRARPQ